MEKLESTLKKEEEDFIKQSRVHDELMGKYEEDINLTVEARQLINMHKTELENFKKK